jgi:hypothetical protein
LTQNNVQSHVLIIMVLMRNKRGKGYNSKTLVYSIETSQKILETKKGPPKQTLLFSDFVLLTYTMFDDSRLEVLTTELYLVHSR